MYGTIPVLQCQRRIKRTLPQPCRCLHFSLPKGAMVRICIGQTADYVPSLGDPFRVGRKCEGTCAGCGIGHDGIPHGALVEMKIQGRTVSMCPKCGIGESRMRGGLCLCGCCYHYVAILFSSLDDVLDCLRGLYPQRPSEA